MSFARLWRTISQPNLAGPAPVDPRRSTSDDTSIPRRGRRASELMVTFRRRPWKAKRPSTTDQPSPSQSTSLPASISRAENPPTESGIDALSPPGPAFPTAVHLTDDAIVRFPEPVPASDPVQDKLAEAWDAVKDDRQIASRSRAVDADAAEKSDIVEAMKGNIDCFSEGIPILMNALDDLASLHPFIGVAVLAFKTVYTLEQKRRDNDKKVISLFVGMKDMMGSLLLLKGLENDQLIAPDGTNIEDHLKSLVGRTVDDIKACSNLCDAYMKKRILARVLLSSVWDARLLGFAEVFATRRQEFEFELTMRTSRGVDEANMKLDVINEQMNAMKALFEQLVSPEQRQLSDLVTAKGGVNIVRNNDKMLLELEKTASKTSGPHSVEGHRTCQTANADLEVDSLRVDILEDPNAAAENNWVVFSRKFEAQKNQIIDELSRVVQRESDRVVRELKGKAHERIRDKLIHELWVEMGWRGNVKARHFVLALRDHYLEKHSSETKGVLGIGTSSVNTSMNPDGWAYKYIDVKWVQPILEAFDDDASGFITIAEVNHFTSSRPADWSLPHWLAFWAVGFKWSLIDYARKIEELFAKMDGVRSVVLPPNREAVDRYLVYVFEVVHTLTAGVLSQSSSMPPGSGEPNRFKSYLEAEETRLGNNLRAVDYIIDGTDTLPLIAGEGRIEKTMFPMLYLLMKRHYEIMRVMRSKILSMRELQEGLQSILYIHNAAIYRTQDLERIFSQRRHDPEEQFQNFAFGAFKYRHNRNALWTVDYVRSFDPQVIPYNDEDEDQNVKPEDILNHGYRDELSLDYSVYDGHSIDHIPNCRDDNSPVNNILGTWNGYSYNLEGVHWGPHSMVTFVLVPAEGDHEFKADAWTLQGCQKISGSWSQGKDDDMRVKFKMSFSSDGLIWASIFFNGLFDPERDALTGIWGISAELESVVGKMEFRRIPPGYLAVYPSIKELGDNKPRALWGFAIAAVRNDIRRGRWAWSYFSQRRDVRKTIIPFLVRSRWFGPPLNAEETKTLHTITRRLTPADACFYDSKADHIRAYTWVHEEATCDSCGGRIGGPRLYCLDCAMKVKESYDSLDLCCEPKCVSARVTDRGDIEGAHEPNHRLVKLRTTVQTRNQGRVYTAAVNAFERVGETCRKIAELGFHPAEETGSEGPKVSNLEHNSNSTEMPAKGDKPHGVTNSPEGAKGGAEVKRGQVQDHDQKLPTCGKCTGPLSFPFWYCMFCEDNLYICNACDAVGVPNLARSSGKHTEEHHLIRCLAPEKTEDKASSSEQRLTSIEGRLGGMQTQLNDLNTRVGNIEQLLQRLVGAPEGRAA